MSYELYMNISEVDGIIREEVEQKIYDLWRACFHDSISYTDFYFKYKVPYNEILSIWDKNKIISMLHLNPYEIYVGKRKVPCFYIVGVATDESYRRLGLMKRLLDAALVYMYKQNMPFTYLMPALKEIYLPFDFQVVYKSEQWDNELFSYYKIKNSDMDSDDRLIASEVTYHKKEVANEHIEVLALSQHIHFQEDLIKYTKEWLKSHCYIYTDRDDFYYTRLDKEMKASNGEILLCIRNGKIVGYLSYMSEEYVHITELIFDDINAKEALFDELLQREDGDKLKEMEFLPSIMTRIVNFSSFIKHLKSNKEFRIVLEVKDEIIKDNNEVYQLSFHELGCEIKVSKESPEVCGDIKLLTKFFFGQMKDSEIEEIIISTDKQRIKELLLSIVSLQNLFINEVV